MPIRKSEAVSIADLSKSISKAVDLAAKRHDVAFQPGNVVYNWEILGRILRDAKFSAGQTRLDVAASIAKAIPGPKLTPVVAKVPAGVLVGFIAPKTMNHF